MRRLRPWPPRCRRHRSAGTRRSRRRRDAGLNAVLDQIVTTEMARAEDRSQLDLKAASTMGSTSVWPSTRSTQANRAGSPAQAREGRWPACASRTGPAIDLAGALGEQHLRLEDETVADHADVGALRQDLAQPAEEFRTVAGSSWTFWASAELSRLPRSAICVWLVMVLGLGRFQSGVQRGELATQAAELLIEESRLVTRASAEIFFSLSRADWRPGAVVDAAAPSRLSAASRLESLTFSSLARRCNRR